MPGQRGCFAPLAVLATAFAAGIIVTVPVPVSVSLCSVSAALSAAVALLCLHNQRNETATAVLIIAFVFSGATLATIEKQPLAGDRLKRLIDERTLGGGEPAEISGILSRDIEIGPGRIYLDMRVERINAGAVESKASGLVSLLLPVSNQTIASEIDRLDLRYGARIRVMTVLERAENFRNPGVSSFTEYLDARGYDATGFVKSPLLIERLEDERVFLPLSLLFEWRRRLQVEIESHFSKDTAGVLIAALLGNRHYLSHSTAERFRAGGTFHVLVISGLHITFIGGLILIIVKRFTKSIALKFLIPVVGLWAYSLAVGAETAVVRAALMFSMVLGATLVSRRASSINVLGGVALALLVWRPSDLFDPSFQLTFMSVLAIVLVAFPVLQKMSEIGSWRPTRETPYPPACAIWLRNLCETIYWSQRFADRELQRTNYSYRLFKAPVAEKLERFHLQRPLRYTFNALVVSTSVQLTLLPFLVFYFHRLSIASFVLNIVVSILLTLVALSAALGLALSQLTSTLASPLIIAADSLNWLMVHSVDPFAKAGIASTRLPEYSGHAAVVYLVYYIPLAILVIRLWLWKPLELKPSGTAGSLHPASRALKLVQRRPKLAKVAFLAQVLACALVVLHPWSAGQSDGRLQIDFLDVGQGDCALITLPDGTTMLFDGGGKPGPFTPASSPESNDVYERETRSIGESVVSEYLWWRGLDKIDYVVATHADADHIDGLNDVIRNFAVRAALVARTPAPDVEYSRLSRTLSSIGTAVRLVGEGDELRVGNARLSVLWPIASVDPLASSANNDSVVVRVQFGERSFLLTGDIESQAEQRMVDVAKNLRSDVVKVAHHGSKSSSSESFIAATRPSLAIISVGRQSVFGHPHAEVVDRWRRLGARVLTTGEKGTITLSTNGSDLTLKTFVDGTERR